jgi:hypothetical protein
LHGGGIEVEPNVLRVVIDYSMPHFTLTVNPFTEMGHRVPMIITGASHKQADAAFFRGFPTISIYGTNFQVHCFKVSEPSLFPWFCCIFRLLIQWLLIIGEKLGTIV